jgi:hypothetical protein
MRAQAEAVIAESGGALRRTMEALEPFLPPKAAPAALTRICYAP